MKLLKHILVMLVFLSCGSQAFADIAVGNGSGGATYSASNPVPALAGGLGQYTLPIPAAGSTDFFDGDSITNGGGATACSASFGTLVTNPSNPCYDDLVSIHDSAKELSYAVSGTCLEYTTTSGSPCNQSSTTNGSLINRYVNTVTHLTSGMRVYMMIGTNDVNAYQLYGDTQISPVTFRANLVTVTNAYAAVVGANNLILGEIPFSPAINDRVRAMMNIQVDSVAFQYGYRIAANNSVLQLCALTNPADGCINTSSSIHPDNVGHAALAASFEAANYASAVTASSLALLAAQSNPGSFGNNNTGCGYATFAAAGFIGASNTACGYQAGTAITSGGSNSFFGALAGSSDTTAGSNTAVGQNALHTDITGTSNVAIGTGALFSSTGGSNVAIGFEANYTGTSSTNTAVGYESNFTGGGTGNTAFGYESLYSGSGAGANDNTSIGYQALYGNTSGATNTALGYLAGRYITGGSTANATTGTSVYLGANTKAYASGDAAETVVGYGATGIGSNSVTIQSGTSPGYYSGTGAPTFSAPNGSQYLRYDGTTGSRLYYNTSGASTSGTTWTAMSSP